MNFKILIYLIIYKNCMFLTSFVNLGYPNLITRKYKW